MIKAALIGTGGIAQQHAEGYLRLKDRVKLTAAVDIRPEALAAFCDKNGIEGRYGSVEKLLTIEKPDLVSICTPPGLHAEQIIQALKGGAWVLCEKPMVGSLADLDRVEAVERETGRHASSVFQWRFGSAALHYKKLIDAGAFGRALTGACLTTWYRNDAYYEVPWRGKWKTELGGCTVGHGIHAMDLFLSFLGDWEEVQARAAALDRKIEVDDVSAALVRFKNGALATILNSVLSPRQETRIRWDFQKVSIEVVSLYHHEPKHWTLSVPDGAAWAGSLPAWTCDPGGSSSGHGVQIAALVEDFSNSRAPQTRGTELRRTLEFLTALYKSSATGMAVRKGSIQSGDPFYSSFNGGRGL